MKTLLTICAIGLCLASVAGADTITLKHNGYGAADVVTFTYNGHSESGYAGVYILSRSDGGQTMPGFCMDILQNSSSSYAPYDVKTVDQGPNPGPMGTAKASYVAELWGRFFNPAWATPGNHPSSEDKAAAAFETAIWEIIYEPLPAQPSQWNVTSGTFRVDTGTVDYSQVNTWLHALDGTGPRANLTCLSNASKQDYLVLGSTVVPEPVMCGLLALGSPIFCLRGRRGR